MRALRFLGRLLLLLGIVCVVLAVAFAIWAATHREEAQATRQAIVIGGSLSGVDRLESATDRLADATERAVRADAGRYPATFVAPATGARHPAIAVLVPDGTTPAEERSLRDAQHAIASAGITAWTLRVPITDQALVDEAAAADLAVSIDAVAAHPTTRDRAVSVVAIGPTASLALAVAAMRSGARALRAVIAIQPLVDIRALVEHRDELSAGTRARVGRALVQVVRSNAEGESGVVQALLDEAARTDDPLATLEAVPLDLAGPSLEPMLRVLQREPGPDFAAAWAQLPGSIRDRAARSSPITFADQIEARVLVVETTRSEWTRREAGRLASALDDARVVAIDASDPGSIDDELGVREALSVSAWWLRAAGA